MTAVIIVCFFIDMGICRNITFDRNVETDKQIMKFNLKKSMNFDTAEYEA